LALTRKQKNSILAEKDKISVDKLSAKLKVPQKEIEEFINSQSGKEKKTAPKWFYLIVILIPFLFFFLLEIGLRVFNYGIDTTQWVKITEDKYILNPEVARRYFYNTENVPYSNQNAFDVIKKENSFRVFILGGSSAAGYPFSPNGDFGRYIKKRLELEYPTTKIEVINIALTAVNSYTLRDLFPGVLEQKPDLILIYAGHNEYYGALGVGSVESLGSSPFIINTALYLNRFKTFELLRNVLKDIIGIFSKNNSASESGGTLMARMAKDKLIKLNSDVYYAGLRQFESNMSDILEEAKDSKVPVILGTLTYNLKDQHPFISVNSEGLPVANNVYNEAKISLSEGNIPKADSLYRLAKDLDGLRFRAPEAFNQIIIKLGKKFNCPVAPVDMEFGKASPERIVGNNLMVDHLHPTLEGYRLMGKTFFTKMEDADILPKSTRNFFPEETADSMAIANIHFSKLDSTVARYRVIILKNDWPFSERKSTEYIVKQFNIQTPLDSIALKVIDSKLTWQSAHHLAAAMYFNNRKYDLYTYETKVLTEQYPFITEYYDEAAENLLKIKQYDYAYELLVERYKYSPSAFSTKWLGIIDLSKNKFDSAIKYLKESTGYDNNDAQVLFNLAGAYSLKHEYQNALDAVNRCLSLNPSFPEAQRLKEQLVSVSNIRSTEQ
jgi:tetratricopeptide (TPR) repeat protein